MSNRLLLSIYIVTLAACRTTPPQTVPSPKTPQPAVDPFRGLPLSSERLELSVDVGRVTGRVPRRLFGTNMEPHLDLVPQVVSLVKELGITTFRFPGGGWPGWRWQKATFDVSPHFNHCALARIENVRDLLIKVKGELVSQVNIETGNAAEAAALVRWLRQKAPDLSAAYFELGNEPYGDWDRAYRSASDYVKTIKEWAPKLRAVDPTVKVGGLVCGEKYDQDLKPDGVDTANWDRVVIQGAAQQLDFLSMHWYAGLQDRVDPLHAMANSLRIPGHVRRFRRLIPEARRDAIEIGYLEWDGVFDQEKTGLRHALANAIFYADALMQMAQSGVALSNQYELNTRSYGLFVGYHSCMKGDKFVPYQHGLVRPKAYALQLLRRMSGAQLVSASMKGSDHYQVTTKHPSDEYQGRVPYRVAYAARRGDRLWLAFISRHPQLAARVTVRLSGVRAERAATLHWLSGPSLRATNEERHGTVRPRQTTIQVGTEFAMMLPPRAVVLLEMTAAPPAIGHYWKPSTRRVHLGP